ncbi:MAG TPA: glycosyl hydrolase family 18 protein [Cytophagales bacterium]|nr:glycosyl hydrolase family 18 protein [Cytophagales bacterium]
MKHMITSFFRKPTALSLFFIIITLLSFQSFSQKKVVGYLPSWVDYNYIAGSIDKLTHLNIAFENPDTDGNLSFATSNNDVINAARAKGVKVLVSIAGGGASVDPVKTAIYFDLISDEKRAGFVQKILTYLKDHNFDGLDVDLEGSAINEDYDDFIKDLSAALKPEGKLLTSALSHVNGGDRINPETYQYFDFINIMAYDATGPWRPNQGGQHSSFEFGKSSLEFWVGRGLPKEKAILGVPFYGYGFWNSFHEGMSYADIIKKYPGSENQDQVADTIYYNGIPTIKAKAQLVLDEEYGGIMIWQIAQDAQGPKSLLLVINEILKIENPTGIKKGFLEKETPVFPNPVKDKVTIENPSFGLRSGQIELLNAAGKALISQKANGQVNVLDLSQLASGLYFIQVYNSRETAFYKVFKN